MTGFARPAILNNAAFSRMAATGDNAVVAIDHKIILCLVPSHHQFRSLQMSPPAPHFGIPLRPLARRSAAPSSR